MKPIPETRTILEIEADEIVSLLNQVNIKCDQLGFTGNKWSYSQAWGEYFEGESKWAFRHYVERDKHFEKPESLV